MFLISDSLSNIGNSLLVILQLNNTVILRCKSWYHFNFYTTNQKKGKPSQPSREFGIPPTGGIRRGL